jgi:hypothetical protein
MLTHVHKVIHLVVGTFDLGWQSWWRNGGERSLGVTGRWPRADLCVQSRFLVSVRSWSCDRTLGRTNEQTQCLCVRSQVTYGDVVGAADAVDLT